MNAANSSRTAHFEPIKVYDHVNPRIVALYDGEATVLDLGCGAGALGERLKQINPDAFVAGVDCTAAAERRARGRLDAFARADLDRDPIPDFSRRFDLVILGDVLEHLRRPDLALRAACELLASPAGRIIVSLPNIAQMRIRRRLLLGHFDYTDTGILDRTHLRFFTYDSALALFAACGLRVVARRFNSGRWAWIERPLFRLVAIQFIFKLAPAP
jgi:2-polyprenyl-3-methyl-5-hydroxy-6-metoxy-1,4-benzoquinol methylase